MENLDSAIKKNALNNGLVLGVIMLILGIITFYVMISIESALWLIIVVPIVFSVILPIAIAIYFTIDLRKKVGGFWDFKQATTGIFIMCLVSFAIQTVGRDVLFAKLIEPDMAKKTQDAVVRATTAMMEKSGADQEKIDKQIESTEKQFDSQVNPTPGKVIQGIGTSILFVFILALILAAFFKRKAPYTIEDAIDPTITDPTA
jgi:hypothetical protein